MSKTANRETICAWCLEENGEVPQEDDTHGICPSHAEGMVLSQYQRKFDAIPSYTSRFTDGRETWEDE